MGRIALGLPASTIRELPPLGYAADAASYAAGLNALGDVVGLSSSSKATHATLWKRGRAPLGLGTLGGRNSSAAAINSRGMIVGQSDVSPLAKHAFVLRNGRMQDLTPVAVEASATDVNEGGSIVGTVRTTGDFDAFLVLADRGPVTLATNASAYQLSDRNVVAGRIRVGGAYLRLRGRIATL